MSHTPPPPGQFYVRHWSDKDDGQNWPENTYAVVGPAMGQEGIYETAYKYGRIEDMDDLKKWCATVSKAKEGTHAPRLHPGHHGIADEPA